MARALLTLTVKDLRLLMRDPGALMLLFLAPLVVISAAGFSLSTLYQSSRHLLPVVDLDRGPVGEKTAHNPSRGSGARSGARRGGRSAKTRLGDPPGGSGASPARRFFRSDSKGGAREARSLDGPGEAPRGAQDSRCRRARSGGCGDREGRGPDRRRAGSDLWGGSRLRVPRGRFRVPRRADCRRRRRPRGDQRLRRNGRRSSIPSIRTSPASA